MVLGSVGLEFLAPGGTDHAKGLQLGVDRPEAQGHQPGGENAAQPTG